MRNNASHTRFGISVVITAHREGLIAAVSARSAIEAIKYFRNNYDIPVEIVVILDNADELTASVLKSALGSNAQFYSTEEGDPGLARNRAVEFSSGEYVSFLDADDLWSFNWLQEAYVLAGQREEIVVHSACNIIFGDERNIWWHVDSESTFFDSRYLEWSNYWDAMAFAKASIYEKFPFRKNNLRIGFGHEDWHWNCLTFSAGIAHKPAPETVHFKRRRKQSQSALVNEIKGTVWPLSMIE
ncbi:glycosyltransferase [Methylobacterium sp. Leaf88]|uniref:glycosyltransferase family 2 protein n=1 Tax=Methylobacterium sp. Leaf88 TaxID=1736244 RepID=UPI0009E85C3F|nr:glycosyltransferase [Methylobacterium sp. Leaf88]